MGEPVIAARKPKLVTLEEGRTYHWCRCGPVGKTLFNDSLVSCLGSGRRRIITRTRKPSRSSPVPDGDGMRLVGVIIPAVSPAANY